MTDIAMKGELIHQAVRTARKNDKGRKIYELINKSFTETDRDCSAKLSEARERINAITYPCSTKYTLYIIIISEVFNV